MNRNTRTDTAHTVAKAAGSVGGLIVGTRVGAALGTALFPGLGTIAGAALGPVVGVTLGRKAARKVGPACALGRRERGLAELDEGGDRARRAIVSPSQAVTGQSPRERCEGKCLLEEARRCWERFAHRDIPTKKPHIPSDLAHLRCLPFKQEPPLMPTRHAAKAFEAGVRAALELFKDIDWRLFRAQLAASAEKVLQTMTQVAKR